ncbi:uncharacterized protein LOC143300189 [Babylonia areolata]|uniref:uncharacterized protein LOC143300189 n=1 Tax=Babylonia areolata TaxID=304850 RepID=UPI003FCF872C
MERGMFKVYCVFVAMVSACLALQCPPGGFYFDKHLGQNGRLACCSELCMQPFLKAQCHKKCPNYADSKAKDTAAMLNSDSGNDNDSDTSSTPAMAISITAIAIIAVIVTLAILDKRRRWGFWECLRASIQQQLRQQHQQQQQQLHRPEGRSREANREWMEMNGLLAGGNAEPDPHAADVRSGGHAGSDHQLLLNAASSSSASASAPVPRNQPASVTAGAAGDDAVARNVGDHHVAAVAGEEPLLGDSAHAALVHHNLGGGGGGGHHDPQDAEEFQTAKTDSQPIQVTDCSAGVEDIAL